VDDTRAGGRYYTAPYQKGQLAGELFCQGAFLRNEAKSKARMCLGMNLLGKTKSGFVQRKRTQIRAF
jgi:hypothetical protein